MSLSVTGIGALTYPVPQVFIRGLLRDFAQLKKADSSEFEKQLQLALNRGEIPTPTEIELLQSEGYSISYNPETLARFKTFVFPGNQQLTEAIQSATVRGGLLVDRYKMYRPGPSSSKDVQGAAKGYDEIFSIFEQQTTEKTRIGKDTLYLIDLLVKNLPQSITILDLGCGNGVQTQQICFNRLWKIIGLDNQVGCIDNCRKLLPQHQFELQDIFAPIPNHLKGQAQVIFISHVYCQPEKASLLIRNLKDYQASSNTLLIFVNGCTGTDADRLAYELPFLRGKPSSNMSQDFIAALEKQGYSHNRSTREAKVVFPQLTPSIRAALLNIRRGDYENPYPHIDPDLKIFKSLMEFVASFPLESMTQEQIAQYVDALEKTFITNGGPFLKICNKMVLAHPQDAEFSFKMALQKGQNFDDYAYQLELVRENYDLNFFEQAKDILGKLLKAHWKDKNKSLEGFKLMADIFLKTDQYPEAAVILWYTKQLGGTDHLDLKIEAVEQTLLKKTSSRIGLIRGMAQARIDHEKLVALRDRIREKYQRIEQVPMSLEKAQALRILYTEITQELKQFIHEISQDVILQLQSWGHQIPCEYALMGLGSLAREEMTPYSDFEFAILIDRETEEAKKYFRLFTTLLHLRFVNFGETILPSLDIHYLDWVYDDITPRGLSFDGSMPKACKTPLGKKRYQKGDYELIQTPMAMSRFQVIPETEEDKQLWALKRYHLPTILSAVTYVTGSNEGPRLVSDYQNQVQTIFKSGEGSKRALLLMEDDLLHFKPRLEQEDNGKHYNVKKDLYRLPNTMFDALASYYVLQSNSSWGRIGELEERHLISSTSAQNFKTFTMVAQELRLATYLKHDRQKEHLDIETHEESVRELYYRSIPFTRAMEAFCLLVKEGKDPGFSLQETQFYEKNSYNTALIHFRHMNYLEAEKAFEEKRLDTLEYDEIYAALENTLGRYKKAEEAYLTAIARAPTPQLYKKLGQVRLSLARHTGEESAEKAFLQALELLKEKPDEVAKEDIYRAMVHFYKEIGVFEKCREHLTSCKRLVHKRTFNKEKDPEYQVVIDLGLAETKQLEAAVIDDLDSQFEEAGKLLEEARQIFKGYYRREDHPTVLSCDACMGSAFRKLGRHEEALKMQTAALVLSKQIFEEKHPAVANSYNNVGGTLGELGRHEEALKMQTAALDLYKQIFREKHPDVATSYNNVGGTLGALGQHEEALKMQTAALDLYKQIFGEKHPDVATSYNNVGCTLGALGRHEEALKMQTAALDLYKQIFGEKHPAVATSYNNVGGTLGALGQHEEALKMLTAALDLRKQIFGEKHPTVATSYNNVGSILGELGQHEEALKMQTAALDLYKQIFGEKHPSVATSYNDVGNALGELGRHEEALKMQTAALDLYKQIFGEKHPAVATSYNNVGSTLGALGRHEEALKMQTAVLDLRKQIFEEKHPAVATSYNDVGNALGELGRHEEALKMQTTALDLNKQIFGEKHPAVATSYNNVGCTWGELGQHEEALKMLTAALDLRKQIFGEKHPAVATSYNNVGSILGALGRHEEALKMQTAALVLSKQIFGEKHPAVATSYNDVGNALGELGRHEEALKMLTAALDLRKQIFGEKHPAVATSYNNVGCTLRELGQHEEALKMLTAALDLRKQIFGEKHPAVANSYNDVGNALGELGRHEEALKMQTAALDLRKQIFGEKHPAVATSYNNVGSILGELGQHEEALKMLTDALDLRKQIFGKKHPAVATSYNNVGSTLGALGRHEEAFKMQTAALDLYKQIFGEKHPDVATSYNNVGHTHLNLNDYFSALLSFKNAVKIYQNLPSYQLHPNTANGHRCLEKAYSHLGQLQKAQEHRQEAQRIEQTLKSLKFWRDSSSQFNSLILKKQYKAAFKLINQGPKVLQTPPEVVCSQMQLSLLCSNAAVVKKRKDFIQQAEEMAQNQQLPPESLLKLQLNLACHWIEQQQWDKAMAYALLLRKINFGITYELLDVLFMKESESVCGETVPADLLGSYLVLKIFERQKKPLNLLERTAQQLLQKITGSHGIGTKVKEIGHFCEKYAGV